MSGKYAALDSAIMKAIESGADPYRSGHAEAERLEAENVRETHWLIPAWRYVDRRLQVMRKKGVIRFDKSAGKWVKA